MAKLTFKPGQRLIADYRLIPKVVVFMLFCGVVLIIKQMWDANAFYHALLSATGSESIAQEYYEQYVQLMLVKMTFVVVGFMALFLAIAHVMQRQIQYLKDSILTMANRDLSQEIDLNCKDEYGDIGRELERTRCQWRDVIQTQSSASTELSSLTDVMAISMSETKQSAEEEFQEVDSLATAMSEMSSTVQTIAEHAKSASDLTEQASNQASTGQEFVQDSVLKINALSSDISASANAVNEVEERVDSIGSVVGTIQSISEQTNLLALNAAIEAARAGEAGRGFAVVADEVRNLAQRTQQATVEIQDMITQLQTSAQSAVKLMEKSVVEAEQGVESVGNAGKELGSIVSQVNQINDMNFQIATAAGQQSTVAEEMSRNVTNVRELVEASVLVMSELQETAELMNHNADELNEKIKVFKI